MVAPAKPKSTRTARPKAGRLVAQADPPEPPPTRDLLARDLLEHVAWFGGRMSLRVRLDRGCKSWPEHGPAWAMTAAADLVAAGLATADGSGDVLELTEKGRAAVAV